MKKPLSNKTGFGCLVLFALPFAAVGVWAGARMVAHLGGVMAARDWLEVPAWVETVALDADDSGDSTTYSVRARYHYELDGVGHRGERVDLAGGSDNIGSYHQDIYAELYRYSSSGEPFRCFVDPSSPVNAVLYRDVRWALVAFHSLFVLIFGGAGFGLLGALPYARRRLVKEEERRSLYPDRPWLWRDEWQNAEVSSVALDGVVGPCLMAGFWNAFSWPMIFFASDQIFDPKRRIALLALVFPAVGLLLLWYAISAVRRYRRFGTSTLELTRIPIPVGGRLVGKARARFHFERGGVALLRISCLERRQRRKGKSNQRLVWQEEVEIAGTEVVFDGRHSRFPVSVALPRDLPPVEVGPQGDGAIRWELHLRAPTAGVDYEATFLLPVFGVAPAETAVEATRSCEAEVSAPSDDQRPQAIALEEMGVSVEPLPEGGSRFEFRRARQKRVAILLSALLVLWTGFLGVMWRFEAPSFFLITFGFAWLLVFLGVLDLWFTSRWFEASRRGLRFGMRLLFYSSSRFVPVEEIAEVRPEPGMRSGDKLYYRVRLRKTDRRMQTLVGKLDNLAVARWLSRAVRDALWQDWQPDGQPDGQDGASSD